MSRHAAHFWTICAIFSLVGCASTNDHAPEQDEPNRLNLPTSQAPPRPEYHAESDAISFGAGESRELVRAGCAEVEDADSCRDEAGRRVRGYVGSFTQPGADEALIALSDSAALLVRNGGKWRALSLAPGVDIDQCLLAAGSGADGRDHLLCRAAATQNDGFGLAFFAVLAGESGALEVRQLDTPRATDVETSLFAGWKSEDGGAEVRFHQETQVNGASTLDFGGPNTCRYRTFGYNRAPVPALVEIEGCQEATSPATARSGQYENQLHDPISAHNRDFVMCYHHELERLKESNEQALAETDEPNAEDPESLDDPEAPGEPISGDIHVRFVIGSSGAPVSCEVARSTMHNENVETCLCREIMKTAFPPVPTGKFVDVTYPFSFAPAAN